MIVDVANRKDIWISDVYYSLRNDSVDDSFLEGFGCLGDTGVVHNHSGD